MRRKPDDPRAIELNDAMWGRLTDIARQVEWPVLFEGQVRMTKMDADDWKNVFTAGLQRQQRMAQQIDGGGYVLLGQRTSKFSNKKMEELLELIRMFGDSRQVRWSAPKRLEAEWDLRKPIKAGSTRAEAQ